MESVIKGQQKTVCGSAYFIATATFLSPVYQLHPSALLTCPSRKMFVWWKRHVSVWTLDHIRKLIWMWSDKVTECISITVKATGTARCDDKATWHYYVIIVPPSGGESSFYCPLLSWLSYMHSLDLIQWKIWSVYTKDSK